MLNVKNAILSALTLGGFLLSSMAIAQDQLILLGTKGGPSLYSTQSLPQSSAIQIKKINIFLLSMF